jgi:hypothetical protein
MKRLPLALAGIAGGTLGLAFALVGFMIAGIPGEIVGICLAIPVSIAFGMYVGRQ